MKAEDLRALVEGGDVRAAVEVLYRSHGSDVKRFVRDRVGAHAAADVCQEVWAAVATGLSGFRFDAEPRVWLLGIARHKSLDAWRRAGAAAESLHSDLARGGPLASLLGVHTAPTPTRELSRKERAASLRAALDALAEDERELLELRFGLGLKPAEISAVLGGVAPNTISQRILRTVRRLRAALEQPPAAPPR